MQKKRKKNKIVDVNSVEFSTTNVLKVFCIYSVVILDSTSAIFFLNSALTPTTAFSTVVIL